MLSYLQKDFFFLAQLKTPCKSQTGLTRTKQSQCQHEEGKELDKALSAGVVRKQTYASAHLYGTKNVQDIILS